MVITTTHWLGLAGVIIAIVFVVLFLSGRCPQCKKAFGLRRTGRVRLGGSNCWYEFVCRKCGYDIWRKHSNPSNTGNFGGG